MSVSDNAIILAAGRGERLLPLTQNLPKCLLDVGGRPLIEHSLAAIEAQGIHEVTIVTGFSAEKLNYLPGRYPQLRVKFIHNADYASTNNVYSLWLARDTIREGFMLFNSDIIYHPAILAGSLASGASHLVVDDYKELGEEEMKVTIEEGRITQISKLLDPVASEGEYIGIMNFGPDLAGEMVDTLDSMVREQALDCFYEHAIDRLCKRQRVERVSTGGRPWTEIDTHEDLAFAREVVLPGVRAEPAVQVSE